uniref:Angiotensin-converting enzyme n=1 Tax=Stomoxys calcitrans TaxID=35570 RepID=A0A1I8PSQ5_STOCA
MLKFQYFCFMLLGLYVTHRCVHAECLTEACAQELVQSIDEKYRINSDLEFEHPNGKVSADIVLRDGILPYKEALDKFDWQNFKSPLLKRQFEILLREMKYPKTDSEFRRNTSLLKNVGKKKFTCSRLSANTCQKVSYNRDIKALFTNSDDEENLKWYWREWRSHLPPEVQTALSYYVSYYQSLGSAANQSASAIWYEGYDDANMMTDLENYMAAIAPLYKEMHGHLRQILRNKYGNAIIPDSGLIPQHLIEQSYYQAWKKDSVLVNPYPEKKLPNMQQELRANWTFNGLRQTASHFFKLLDFPPYPSYFQYEGFKPITNSEDSADCKARINYHGKVRMAYCEKVNYKRLLTTHGDITRLGYALQKNKLPVGLSREACPGFGNAMAEAVILTVSTPKHLQQNVHLLTEYNYDDEMHLNFLYRMAVHALFSVPMYFVHEKLWVDMIDNNVRPWNYKCHYWNLMEKYMGVGPSDHTYIPTFDMNPKFYEGVLDGRSSTKKLFGEFLGYQIYRDLCLKTDLYQPGNADKPLFKCNLHGQTEAGDILMKMMSAGATKPWREIIKDLTPNQETKLQGSAFMDYYQPLLDWLKQDNAAKNVQIGWKSIDNCINPTVV